MRFLRNIISNLGKRRYAQVHDVRVEYSRYPAKDILEEESSEENMSQSLNGTFALFQHGDSITAEH
jgi:hypothetical protein